MLIFDAPTTPAAAEDPSHAVVRPEGEVDFSNAVAVRTAIRDAFERGGRDVVVDLSDVSFIDAAGLGVLVGGQRLLATADGRLRVANPQPGVRRVLEVTALDRLLGL